jgi:hypothetical protein
MEPEGSLPSSQELSTCTYPEPDQSSPQNSPTYNGQNLAVHNYGVSEILRLHGFVVRKLLKIKRTPI